MRRFGPALFTVGLAFAPRESAAQDRAPANSNGAKATAPPASATPTSAPVPPAPAVPPAPEPTPSATPTTPTTPAAAGAGDSKPLYYVEQEGPRHDETVERLPPPPPPDMFEPPPPRFFIYEPPPPPPLPRRAPPRSAFWVGVRAGWLVPFGSLWLDGFDNGAGTYFRRRNFSDYASSGPLGELDIGARISRRYNVFGIWEHASLGTGSYQSYDPTSFGGQERGATNFYGLGLRFSTDPTSVGFLMEVALGYRDFRAYWSDGSRLTLSDGWLDARIGIGADIRLSHVFSLSPMIVLGGGSFGNAAWSGSQSGSALTGFDQSGEYGTLSFQLGAHADVF